jgi:hypothetical protein
LFYLFKNKQDSKEAMFVELKAIQQRIVTAGSTVAGRGECNKKISITIALI